jgi:nucleoside-diphosphate-sugar epimerase
LAHDLVMKRRILLLGCSGEIGSRLTLLLLDSGFEVFGVRGARKCSITNASHSCKQVDLLSESVDIGFGDIKPEILVHTAWVTSPGEFWTSPMNHQWLNASKRLIEFFESSGGKYIVVTGTCAEYTWGDRGVLDESSPELPSSVYGNSKLELLNWLRGRTLPFLWTRTFFQFGGNELTGRLIPSIIDSLLSGEEFVVRNGNDVRDFVFVDDVSRLLDNLITKSSSGIFNLGTGAGIRIQNLAEMLGRMLLREDLVKIESADVPSSSIISNPAKLISVIGEFTWTPLEEALSKSITSRIYG